MVVVGDITQIDLVTEHDSGLKDALKKLKKINDIGFVELKDFIENETFQVAIDRITQNF